MSNNLNLSVVLPTINRPDDLVRAVTSILRQNELPYELIIVDQSVDSKSHNNIKDLFSKLKPNTKLVYIHDSSIKGLVSAKNHGVKKSNGEIISFLEDDEFLDKNYLKNTINLFDKNEHILGCCGIVSNIRRSFFYEIMFKLFHQGLFFDKRVDAVKYKDSDGKGILISSTHLSGGISSYRREVFESIEYDLRTNFFYCEDIDFSIRASDFFGRNRFVIATNIFLAHYMSNINRDVLQPRWMRKTNEFILLYKKNKHKKYSYLSVIWLMVGLFFEAIYSSIITFSIGPVVGFFIGLYSGINYKIIDTYSVRKTSKEDFANEMVYSNKSSNNKKTRNIIFLTKYGNLAASSRLRAYQYKDKINSPKWNIEVQSLLSNKYLENRFKNNSFNVFVLFHVVYLFLVRLFFLLKLKNNDIIIIHFELFPFIPPLVEWVLFKCNKNIYFDYDDAIFHNYDLSDNLYIKFFLSNKIEYLMKMSAGVIAGNQYILQYAQNAGAKKVLKMPTVIDIDKYATNAPNIKIKDRFTVGWIGSPSTTKYLEIVKEPLSKLGLEVPILLYLVGADSNYDLSIDNVKIVSVPWSELNEQEALKIFDVGIMPLYDNPWEKGKCAFKLIQYMASFLPVIASNVGMNSEIISNYENGFIVKNSGDWYDCFYKIYSHPPIKIEMGIKGRELVEKNFTIQSRLAEFENFLNN